MIPINDNNSQKKLQVVSEPGLKLGLKFRPEDRFCKSVFGHPVDSRGLLLKIKIRKKKSSSSTDEDTKPVLVSTEIVGCVEKSFVYDSKFNILILHNSVCQRKSVAQFQT